MSLRKIITWSLITLAVLGVALIFASCVPDIIANNRHLHQMEKALLAIPPAPQSKQLAVRSAVGLLTGNGNHCDFFAGALFQSSATPDSIRQHYAGRTFLNPITSKQETIDVTIITNSNDLEPLWLPNGYEKIEAWGLSQQSFTTGTVFLVHIMRSYKANNDCRCQ
jgi:hypothetical protein